MTVKPTTGKKKEDEDVQKLFSGGYLLWMVIVLGEKLPFTSIILIPLLLNLFIQLF